jgi:hemerythrin-like domain-containing protein
LSAVELAAERARRRFLRDAVGVGGAVLAAAAGLRASAAEQKEAEEAVSPTEDLMREHGVLRRILLVYGEVIRRVHAGQPVDAEPVGKAATIIRAFIEDYHEKDEEEFIFPRFRKAGKLTGLVDVLIQQHQAGRTLTAGIQRLANPAALGKPSSRAELAEGMRQFIRMYEPHSAREDTVLFPVFAELISEKEMRALMETFEQKEKALPLGDFEKMVAEVAAIEKTLRIDDLARFTPKVAKP